jgi:hypothetical protein
MLGIVVSVVLLALAIEVIAAEDGEVVVLRTLDESGAPIETRLWIVDHEGQPFLRAGNEGAGWFGRLRAKPEVEVVRGEETLLVRAVPEPAARERVNALMAEKYGWADAYIGAIFSRDDSVPVRLEPR